MDFKLFDSKVEGINVSITVHIGPYSISVDEYRWDKSFERENSLKGISISKTMEAAGVGDTEALKTYMLDNFGTEKGADKFARFLENHNIRCEHEGNTRYI